MFHAFVPRYSLHHRALAYCRVWNADGARYAPQARHGLQSDPALRVTVLREQVLLEVEHHYTSGHMWVVDPQPEAIDGPLEDHLAAGVLSEIDALQADSALWTPEVLLGLFTTMRGAEPDPVPPSEADWLEWGDSTAPDGKLPHLTLRLGRHAREIVLDHAFTERESLRRLEPVATPATLDQVRDLFGRDMEAAARRLDEDPGRWLP